MNFTDMTYDEAVQALATNPQMASEVTVTGVLHPEHVADPEHRLRIRFVESAPGVNKDVAALLLGQRKANIAASKALLAQAERVDAEVSSSSAWERGSYQMKPGLQVQSWTGASLQVARVGASNGKGGGWMGCTGVGVGIGCVGGVQPQRACLGASPVPSLVLAGCISNSVLAGKLVTVRRDYSLGDCRRVGGGGHS